MTHDTDPGPPDDDIVSIEADSDPQARRDHDPVLSLRDTDEESGDEDELADTFDVDEREAREAGVELDGGTDDEAGLD